MQTNPCPLNLIGPKVESKVFIKTNVVLENVPGNFGDIVTLNPRESHREQAFLSPSTAEGMKTQEEKCLAMRLAKGRAFVSDVINSQLTSSCPSFPQTVRIELLK